MIESMVADGMPVGFDAFKNFRVFNNIITDAKKCVYAGYSLGNKARSAHKVCWDKNLPKSKWAYPTDDAS